VPEECKIREEAIDDPARRENYPGYDRLVANAEVYAYAFRNETEFGHNRMLKEYLKERNIKYRQEQAEDFTIYWDFSEEIRPEAVGFDKRWRRGAAKPPV